MEDLSPEAMEQATPLSPPMRPECFSQDCPSRGVLDQIADKWSLMILAVLSGGPTRFNEIKRRLEGISQKSLSQTLRKLERNGLVRREVLNSAPVAVQYSLSPLGHTLLPHFRALYCWTHEYLDQIDAARQAFDARQG
ncbi:winged helix-turn-helix transcriptional regulator [Oceanicola sp. S124]|uniref:winged helix-turn-helix transcriptional regulator n=1 Tax=Oceanicola sp. S124 TaxID=1042378 RepID=UPI00025585D5|nr:helix-turn-helix domain-containing protein [Oceanicola sp. S124]